MKRILPYFIAAIVIGLLLWLSLSTQKDSRVFDDRVSFNRRDKIPYGLYVAYKNLSHIFPDASIIVNNKGPLNWRLWDGGVEKQALIAIVPVFRADEFEMKRIIDFIKSGNNVFISTATVSYDIQTMLRCEIPDADAVIDNLSMNNSLDSFSVSLSAPPFSKGDQYSCPGKRLESYFSKFDSGTSTVLGNGIYILPDLIEFKAGKGSLFLHLTPLAFTNYFLLYGDNMNYYNKVLSLIPRDTKKVIWDEFFLHKRFSGNDSSSGDSGSVLPALLRQRSFKAALLLLSILLLLFILQEMRRKQRPVPSLARPQNDSLEFVKTIGRLYYEKRDNKNLCKKMAAYFLEHIRSRYKLSTSGLDDEFIAVLQRKTAQPENNVREIISFINNIDGLQVISDEQLLQFHEKLEDFYRTG
ncbi:MAG TPA: hypothetical protein VGI82_11640 [Chitinophagaceae bacterium]